MDAYLKALADAPISPEASGGCIGASRRASKIWLPEGKRSPSSRAERDRRKEVAARQIDIEEAIETAGGHRGSNGAA